MSLGILLLETIKQLTDGDFDELIFRIRGKYNKLSSPSSSLNKQEKTIQLLNWADSARGCGYEEIEKILSEMKIKVSPNTTYDENEIDNSLEILTSPPLTTSEYNSFVYLIIKLEPKADPQRFDVSSQVAIPQTEKVYVHHDLINTFKSHQTYTKIQIGQKFGELIGECNEILEKKGIYSDPGQFGQIKISIEFIVPTELLSSDFDCIERNSVGRIGCGNYYSVHVRSLQRLDTITNKRLTNRYRQATGTWKEKWCKLQSNLQNLCASQQYILARSYQTNFAGNEDQILGINLPENINKIANIYDKFIEWGIPLAIYSRCENNSICHVQDLDNLVELNSDQTLNLLNLCRSIRQTRARANSSNPNHIGHHLCFLWENPYNYPTTKKMALNQ